MVVSVKVKGKARLCQVWIKETNVSEPLLTCRNRLDDVKIGVIFDAPRRAQRAPVYCLSGIRHEGGVNLIQALVWNVRICRCDAKEEIQVENP